MTWVEFDQTYFPILQEKTRDKPVWNNWFERHLYKHQYFAGNG